MTASSSLFERLTETGPAWMLDPMRIDEAIDTYIGACARRGHTPGSRQLYRRILNQIAAQHEKTQVAALTVDDVNRIVDQWQNLAPSTLANRITIVRGFFAYLHDEGRIRKDPAARLKRPPQKRTEDLKVVTVSTEEANRMLNATRNLPELLAVLTIVYLGVRRHAAAQAVRGDVNLERGLAVFQEKGGRTHVTKLPDEYAALIRRFDEEGVWDGPGDYLIPNERPARVHPRSDRFLYHMIRRIAERAGVRCHVHALRAAFAVRYLETHPGDLEALQGLMGHARTDTTRIYLRRHDRMVSMERVRDLSWGARPDGKPQRPEYSLAEPRLPEPFQRKLESLKRDAEAREAARDRR